MEKQSEHPLARAIVSKIENLIPSKVEEYKTRFKVQEFKNRDGEGVVAKILDTNTNEVLDVACGNRKLANYIQASH